MTNWWVGFILMTFYSLHEFVSYAEIYLVEAERATNLFSAVGMWNNWGSWITALLDVIVSRHDMIVSLHIFYEVQTSNCVSREICCRPWGIQAVAS